MVFSRPWHVAASRREFLRSRFRRGVRRVSVSSGAGEVFCEVVFVGALMPPPRTGLPSLKMSARRHFANVLQLDDSLYLTPSGAEAFPDAIDPFHPTHHAGLPTKILRPQRPELQDISRFVQICRRADILQKSCNWKSVRSCPHLALCMSAAGLFQVGGRCAAGQRSNARHQRSAFGRRDDPAGIHQIKQV